MVYTYVHCNQYGAYPMVYIYMYVHIVINTGLLLWCTYVYTIGKPHVDYNMHIGEAPY